jgi:branched-chain amino acid transport system substrate-binding protein
MLAAVTGVDAAPAAGLPPLRVAVLAELSGAGQAAGSSFRNGVDLAIGQVNANGGILGQQLEAATLDTRSDPAVAKALAQQAARDGAFAVFGPVYSGSVLSSMAETQKAEVPQFIGGEAAAITQQGNPYVFRTSFTQATAMPKLVNYMAERTKIRRLAAIYVDNDFGRGGMESMRQTLAASPVALVASVATQPAQADFAAAVGKLRESNADAVFVYCNEEESARVLRELRKQGWTLPILGESTLTNPKVIDLAGDAANGVIAHVGLTVDAPIQAIRSFRQLYLQTYKLLPDHNSMKGYAAVHVMKAALERAGRADRKALAQTMRGLKVNPNRVPGALMYTEYDHKGDLDRMSFLVQVRERRQEVMDYLPPLSMNSPLRAATHPATAAAATPATTSAPPAATKPAQRAVTAASKS